MEVRMAAMTVKHVGVLSVAKIYGALSGAMGLLFGIILAIASTVGAGLGGNDVPAFLGPMLGVGAIIFLPVFYGLMGLCMGAIVAALYNLLAGVVGGVAVEIE
jgi:hypothetical protein